MDGLNTSFLGGGNDSAPQPVDTGNAADSPTTPFQTITPNDPPTQSATDDVQPNDLSSLNSQPSQPSQFSQPSQSVETPAEPNEEELRAIAENPATPAFAREKMKQTFAVADKVKADFEALQTEYNGFKSQYEGKEILDTPEIERLKEAEARYLRIASFGTTPEDLDAQLKEANPSVYRDYSIHKVWQTLEKPDGTPDFENLQAVFDRFTGDKRVDAKTALEAIQALADEKLSPTDWREFTSDEEYSAFQRAQELERQNLETKQHLKAEREFQEIQNRTTLLQQSVGQIQSQFQPAVEQLMEKFKLNPVPNEPKIVSDFKADTQARIAHIANSAATNNPAIAEAFRVLQMLGKPTGLSGQDIQKEIQQVTTSYAFTANVQKGISTLLKEIEKVVTADALRLKYLARGYDLENSNQEKARAVVGNPNQSANLPNYSQEQLAGMNARERNHLLNMQISNELRNGGINRLGQ